MIILENFDKFFTVKIKSNFRKKINEPVTDFESNNV